MKKPKLKGSVINAVKNLIINNMNYIDKVLNFIEKSLRSSALAIYEDELEDVISEIIDMVKTLQEQHKEELDKDRNRIWGYLYEYFDGSLEKNEIKFLGDVIFNRANYK